MRDARPLLLVAVCAAADSTADENESVILEVIVLCFLGAVVVYWVWSFIPYLRALGSADNIWERTKKHKAVTLTLADGQQREFRFHQQYREAGMGVGSCVWDGAIVLSQYILQNAERVKDKRVLIVGAGLGLEAMAVALAGASEVLCTDGDALLEDLTNENIHANLTQVEASTIKVMTLLWGDEEHLGHAKEIASTFDVILGSDVVYESSINKGSMLQAYEGLFETFLHLSNLNTTILLAYKPRFPTEPFFFNIMHEYFKHIEIDTEITKESPISIFKYERKKEDNEAHVE